MLSRNLNARLDARIRNRPDVDRRARPRAGGEHPPGIEPTRVPAAYPAVSTPADAFDRCSSRVSVGSSGTTAA